MRFAVGLCAVFLAGCGAATDADLGPEDPETERLRAELEEAREEMDRLRAEAEAKGQETPAAEPQKSAPPPTSEAPPEPEKEVAPEPEIEAPPEPAAQPEEAPAPEPQVEQPEPPPEVEVEIEVAPPAPPPEPEPLPPPEPPAVCGDGIVQGAEVCERDPVNHSYSRPWNGMCNERCSAIYQTKRIRKVLIGGPALGGVAGADALCQAEWGPGWKALIVGEGRRATVTPLMGDGQIDWVIQPWTIYVEDSGRPKFPDILNPSENTTYSPVVWLTESIPLLGVHDDSTEREYHPDIDTSRLEGETHLAGYRADWTSGATCRDWTVDRGAEFTTTFWRDDQQRWDDYDFGCISVPSYLRCVEQ